MKMISRAGWNARAPKKTPEHVAPSHREYFVVHHSGATATQSVRAIQDWCMDGRGFADVDYNFLVDQEGKVYEGRGWDVVGAHCTDFNTNGIGVCVIGNDDLSDAVKASLAELYRLANARCGKTLKLRGHRQLATTGTTCPGSRIYAWVQAGMPLPAKPAPVEDPMARLDPADVEAIAQRLAELNADDKLVTLTKATAERLGRGENEKIRGDLLDQRAVIDGVDNRRDIKQILAILQGTAQSAPSTAADGQ
ncbi:hypothetical protein GCM10010435_44530 [Winogradskya consettensis]|uniref:N-acetylmuramoyl-L-alanine amidase n=1 Tax=Winogradskya consettensis TaxID=113560 RepID=A0A919SZY6_9ACTN|nr:N-acetylmuramoyl-L-alanine amidase [Actinoplanes consettensis]GIM82718.1 hypothetical protein Aco04nite_82920 [Actinoplanes consettensis]